MSDRQPIPQWEGDLTDDCVLRVGRWVCHCECLGDHICRPHPDCPSGSTEEWNSQSWFVGVYHEGEQFYSSADPGGMITSGDQARAICEAIIRGREHE